MTTNSIAAMSVERTATAKSTSEQPERDEPQPPALCDSVPSWQSDQLLQGHREVQILHAGQVYRLVRTRQDKLVLQK